MSFLKKGLLANYITNFNIQTQLPRSYEYGHTDVISDRRLNVVDSVRKAWSEKTYNNGSAKFIFFDRNAVSSVFKFSLAPQSVEISFPQRIFETKTFGGSVFENYGNDTITFNIQGTTANSLIRCYVCGGNSVNGTEIWGSGNDELFSFRNEVQRFNNIKELNSDKEIKFIYDNHSYSVFIKNFNIKMSKENPLAYFYTIEMIGFDIEKKTDLKIFKQNINDIKTFKDKLNEIYANFNSFVENIEGYLNVLEAGLQYFDDFLDICAFVKACIARTEKALNNLVNQFLAYVDGVTSCTNELTNLSDYVVSSAIRMSLGTVDKALNCTKELVEACDKGLKFFEDFSDTYGEMSDDIIDRWEMTSDEIVETCKYMFVNSKEKAEALQAEIQQTTSSCDAAVIPGDKNNDDEIVFVYGIKEYTLTSNENWESLAVKFYGDATKASLLSSFNNQKLSAKKSQEDGNSESTSEEIGSMPSAGTTVYIPILEDSGGFDGTNQVFNQPDVVDNYGHDLEIGENGDFNFHNGDFLLTDSVETLMQGVINRLSTAIGTRLRDTVYGIRTNIGDTDNTIQIVIQSSIEATLLADPRIKSVDKVEFNGSGDKLNVTVEFTDINDNQNVIGGTF